MKNLLILPLILISLASNAQFGKYFKNATCRIDYYHSGNRDVEYYSTDEIIKEGKWYGSRKKLIDPFDYGMYKFMVFDSASNRILFTRNYSTLFLEYRSTEEAKSQSGNFPESVVFPFPKNTVRVEFYSRGKDLIWDKQHQLYLNPNDPLIKEKKTSDWEYFSVVKNSSPKKSLDILFIPEGYTAGQMGKFRKDCDRFAGYIFRTDPYNKVSENINVWGVLSPSEEEGTDIPSDSVFRNTLLSSNFSTFGTERYLTTSDFKAVRNAASCVPSDQIIILVNHERYGGSGIYNFYCMTTTDDDDAEFLVMHEFGHAFAGLGDEYYSSDVAFQDFYDLTKEPWEPNLTTLVNFESKWKDMLPEGTPIPTPVDDQYKGKVGVFEGGGYTAKGIYRPYLDCSMNVVIPNNFCPVCKRAIERRVGFYSE